MTKTDIDTIKKQLQSIKNDLLIQQTQKNMLEKQINDIDTKLDDKLFAIKEAGYNVGLSENAINIAIEAIRQVNDNDKVVKN